MKLSPRYEGPIIVDIEDRPSSQLAPVTRQRRRFQDLLSGLTDEQWAHRSRCDGWTTFDVVAHLASVNEFWSQSVDRGLAAAPTRWLDGFDPAATPPLLVAALADRSPGDLLEHLTATNDALLATLADLDDHGWSMLAEAPVGHVPIRLLAQHALWDSWVHERDVALPLGITAVVEDDEVASCLRYAAVISPAMAIGAGVDGAITNARYAVEATGPDLRFVVEVGESISLRDEPPDPSLPCLRGSAVELAEALSLRVPMGRSTPPEWTQLLAGLRAAFDAG